MENQGILYKIKSKYIINNIFNYIRDTNIQLKLFNHSKYFQNKLNIKLINYKELYLKKIGFKLEDYLYSYREQSQKGFLKEKYDNFLLSKKFNKEKFEDDLYELLENKNIKDIDEEEVSVVGKAEEKLININSPLFESISRTKIFENNISIYISQDKEFNKSKKEYIIFFDKLNKSGVKYSSIHYDFEESDEINSLKDLNIDFSKIKKLTLNLQSEQYLYYKEEKKNIFFFRYLFSFYNIENNLIYLKINFWEKKDISPELFEKINTFKSLKYLFLQYFLFINNFTIKISNLELLSCRYCNNIKISKEFCPKLKILYLTWQKISDINFLENLNLKELNLSNNNIRDIKVLEKIKSDKLEILNLSSNIISNINILKNVNLKELKELNLSSNQITDIKVLENIKFDKLEKLDLSCNKISDINILQNVNFKELKKIQIYLHKNNISDKRVLEKVKFNVFL